MKITHDQAKAECLELDGRRLAVNKECGSRLIKGGTMIRLLAVDMDGTLLNPHGRVSLRNAMALAQLQEEGAWVVVCTGRGYSDAREPLEEAGIVCDLICMNGSAIYSREGLQIHKQTMRRDQIQEILRFCRDEQVVYDFMTGFGSCTITPVEERIFFPGADIPMERFHERFCYGSCWEDGKRGRRRQPEIFHCMRSHFQLS